MRSAPYAIEWLRPAGSRVLLLVALLPGCASEPSRNPDGGSTTGTEPAEPFRAGDRVIPPLLVLAVEDPYRRPEALDCSALATDVAELDAVLGPDADEADPAARSDVVADAFAAAFRSLIPYRSVLRVLTGANAREKRALAAIAAGDRRRAYLKGLAEAQGCAAPPAPRRRPTPPPQEAAGNGNSGQ